MGLETTSLLYRRPDIYDAVARPDTSTIVGLIDAHRAAPAASLLDIGCATGALLAELPSSYTRRVGIDIQPQMIDYARRFHPQVVFHATDARNVSLGQSFDAITCIGLTLAYLHEDQDLTAAINAISAHTHPGTVVVLHTLTERIEPRPPICHTIPVNGTTAQVTTGYEWNDPFLTMRRTWQISGSPPAEDILKRRVWPADRLKRVLTDAGLTPVKSPDSGYIVAVSAQAARQD